MRASIAWPRWRRAMLLCPRQRLAARDRDLRAHEIDARHLLGHRDARPAAACSPRGSRTTRASPPAVERGTSTVPGVAVPGRARERDRRVAHPLSQRRRQRRRRRFFDDLLMTPLDGAFALEQVHDVAVIVGEHLDLDVPRPLDEALDVQRAVAERGRSPRAAPARCRAASPRSSRMRLHADAAAAGRRLEEHREADLARRGARWPRWTGPPASRPARPARRPAARCARAAIFEPRRSMTSAGGPMNVMPACCARGRERGVLGQESVAGMDGVRARLARGRRGSRRSTGSSRRRRRADAHRAIGEQHVQRVRVGVRVDRDGRDAELAAGADDADRDLAAVGDQDLRDTSHDAFRFSRNARSPSWPSFETRCAAMASAVSPGRVERAARPHARDQRLGGRDRVGRRAQELVDVQRRPSRPAGPAARPRARGRSPSRARR